MVRSRWAFLAALLTAPLGATAADLPRSGSDTYTTAFVSNVLSVLKGVDRSSALYESHGISRNESGGEFFANLSTVCHGVSETVGGITTGRGTCIDADKDGDQVISTYEGKGGSGIHTFVGGTGKYAGITGTASFTSQPMRSVDGKPMNLVTHKATWKLP